MDAPFTDEERETPYTQDQLKRLRHAWRLQHDCDMEDKDFLEDGKERLMRSDVIVRLLATIEAKDGEIKYLREGLTTIASIPPGTVASTLGGDWGIYTRSIAKGYIATLPTPPPTT